MKENIWAFCLCNFIKFIYFFQPVGVRIPKKSQNLLIKNHERLGKFSLIRNKTLIMQVQGFLLVFTYPVIPAGNKKIQTKIELHTVGETAEEISNNQFF